MSSENPFFQNHPEQMAREIFFYHFNTKVKFKELREVRACFAKARNENEQPNILMVNADSTPEERLYLYIHLACHSLLGHTDRPASLILEPRIENGLSVIGYGNIETGEKYHKDANALCKTIYSKENNFLIEYISDNQTIPRKQKNHIMGKALLLRHILAPYTGSDIFRYIGEDSW